MQFVHMIHPYEGHKADDSQKKINKRGFVFKYIVFIHNCIMISLATAQLATEWDHVY